MGDKPPAKRARAAVPSRGGGGSLVTRTAALGGGPGAAGALEELADAIKASDGARGRPAGRKGALRLTLPDRGVSLQFLAAVLGPASGRADITPGQLVHGRSTAGPPDDWTQFDAQADPHSIRALTAHSGTSLVETASAVFACTGSTKGLSDAYFGPATDFISYTWHDITCGELFAAISTVVAPPPDLAAAAGDAAPRYFWLDILAVAQNETPAEDLEFKSVIAASQRAIAVMHPWANPRMLSRCWCLHELDVVFANKKELQVALLPSEAESFRGAISANFGSILMTLVACIDSERAEATRSADKTKIFGEIKSTIGFRELNVRVLMLLNSWLREQHVATSGDECTQRPVREQVLDFIGRLDGVKHQVAAMGLDPTVRHRKDDGVLYIGGEDGIIIGCTDASAYIAGITDAPSATVAAGLAAAASETLAHAVDATAPEPLASGVVFQDYSVSLRQHELSQSNNKFFKLQVVACGATGYFIYFRWGRVGEIGANRAEGPVGEAEAVKRFMKKFKARTGNKWSGLKNLKVCFVKTSGKYVLSC
eukprot:SAG22_NODE_101_length_20519_cov_15.588002_18_plen_541_part_00